MHPDERPTVSLTEARRREKRALLRAVVCTVAYIMISAFGLPWYVRIIAAVPTLWFALRFAEWTGFGNGRRAAEVDYWRRQREGRL